MEKIWNRNFILLACSNFLICISYYSMVSVLPIYLAESFLADKSIVGIIMASFMIASVVIRPFAGFALDRYGRRVIFTTALLINSILFLGYVFVTYVEAIGFLRITQGLTWGVATISGSILVADNIPAHKRGEGFGYYSLSTTMAMAVGPVAGLFISNHFGFSSIFWSLVGVCFVSFSCTTFIKYPKIIHTERVHFNWRKLFDATSIGASLNLMIIMSAYGGLLSFVALYGREMGISNTSWFFLIFAIGIASARFGAGRVFDKNGPLKMLSFCLILLIFGFLYLAFLKNSFAYYSSGILLGYGIGAVFPIFQAMINNMASVERRGAANSTLYTALDLGMGAGMIVTGFIGDLFGISIAFALCSLIILAGLLMFRRKTMSYYMSHKL